jgi:hypothetical protein
MSDDEFGPRDLIPAHVRPLDVDEFDADGDGRLDMDEQRRMLGSLPGEEARLVRMELYQADKDGDGTVDMEEMRDFLAARRETRRRCCLSCVATLALVFLTVSVADTPKDYLEQRAVAAEGIPGLDPNNLECSDPCAYPHVRALLPRPPRAACLLLGSASRALQHGPWSTVSTSSTRPTISRLQRRSDAREHCLMRSIGC